MGIYFQESRGLVVNRRTLKMMVQTDPLELGENVWHRFEREVFDLCQTETTSRVLLGGHEVQDGGTHNDFYGFATSYEEIVQEAEKKHKKYAGTGAVVQVIVTLKVTPSITTKNPKRFYHGSVSYAHIPWLWFFDGEGPDYDNRPRGEQTETEYVIWENGAFTNAFEGNFKPRVRELMEQDTSSDIRYDPEGKWQRHLEARQESVA